VQIAAQATPAEASTPLGLLERHVPQWRVVVAVLGVPLMLDAVAFGIGSDLAAWWAPWSLFGACGFIAGARAGRATALAFAIVALVAGPAPLAGVAAGAATGELACRGLRTGVALLAAIPAGILVTALFATAWA
jgi:hypothetical protein